MRFTPALEGLAEPEYVHWLLASFTDFPVSGVGFTKAAVPSEGLLLKPCSNMSIWHILACRERKAGCLVELYVLPIVAKSDPERVRGRQI